MAREVRMQGSKWPSVLGPKGWVMMEDSRHSG